MGLLRLLVLVGLLRLLVLVGLLCLLVLVRLICPLIPATFVYLLILSIGICIFVLIILISWFRLGWSVFGSWLAWSWHLFLHCLGWPVLCSTVERSFVLPWFWYRSGCSVFSPLGKLIYLLILLTSLYLLILGVLICLLVLAICVCLLVLSMLISLLACWSFVLSWLWLICLLDLDSLIYRFWVWRGLKRSARRDKENTSESTKNEKQTLLTSSEYTSPLIQSYLGVSAESILPCKRSLPPRRWFSFASIGLISSHHYVPVVTDELLT